MKTRFYILALSYRIIAAIALFLIYSQYYSDVENSDVFRFYKAGEEIQNKAVSEPKAYFDLLMGINNHPEIFNSTIENHAFENQISGNNISIILLNSLISFVSFDSYLLHFIIYNILAFLGLYWVHFFFSKLIPENKKLFAIVIFFLPTMIFWSAGPLKEVIIIFLTGLILRLSLINKLKLNHLINLALVIFSSFLLFKFRAFFAILFIGFYIVFLINKFRKEKRTFISYAVLIFMFFAFAIESDKIIRNGVIEIMHQKHLSFIEIAEQENSSSLCQKPRIENNIKSLFTESPHAAINLFLRPFPWNNTNFLGFLSFIENLMVIAFLIIIFFKSNLEIKNKNLLYFCILSGLLIAISYALIVPVTGALVRYKSIPILFLLLGIIQFTGDYNFKILKT